MTEENRKQWAQSHHVVGNSVRVGRIEVARMTDEYQAQQFVVWLQKKYCTGEEVNNSLTK